MSNWRSNSVIPMVPVRIGSLPRVQRFTREMIADELQVHDNIDHVRYANPTHGQIGPSCGGNAWANATEVEIRRAVAERDLHAAILSALGHLRWQANGEFAYSKTLAALGARGQEGLTMDQISRIPEVLGLSDGIDYVEKPVGMRGRREALTRGPLVLGVATSPAWAAVDDVYIEPAQPDPSAGHAICQMGELFRPSPFGLIQNSWVPWGRYGYAVMNGEYIDYIAFDFAVRWQWKPGWIRAHLDQLLALICASRAV